MYNENLSDNHTQKNVLTRSASLHVQGETTNRECGEVFVIEDMDILSGACTDSDDPA